MLVDHCIGLLISSSERSTINTFVSIVDLVLKSTKIFIASFDLSHATITCLLNAMSKDHHDSGFKDHVVADVGVVAGHHHHRLLTRYSTRCVLLVLPAIHLTRLQCLQTRRPSSLMCIFHQLRHYVNRTTRFLECPLTH